MSMKIKVALLLVTALASAGCAKKVDVAKERDALKATEAEWSKASTSADGFVSYFAADAALLPPNEPAVTGTENLRGWASKMMGMPGFNVSWQTNVAEVAASGDVGYTSGTYELHLNGPDGAPVSDHGKYVTVYKKDASGAWKAVLDTFNSDVPMGGAPADTSKTVPAK